MVQAMRETGLMINFKAKELKSGQMEENILVIGKRVKNMGKE